MTVIPLPHRAEPEPLAFTIGARIDLRIGALASGVVRPRGATEDTFGFSTLARLLRAARLTWRERGAHAPLTLAIPAEVQHGLDPDLLDAAAVEGGCTRASFGFELDERQLVARGDLADDLRARGWSLSLRADDACPLPFGARARARYSEIVIDVPDAADPYLALDARQTTPLGRRILAAKAAGLTITAACVHTAAQARLLAVAGFDRGGGPFAESGLR